MVDHPTILHLLDSSSPRAKMVSAVLRPAKSASELIRYAETVFGDADKAERWLSKPKVFLDGKTPKGVIDSPSDREKIDEMLVRIEYGMIG